MNRQNEREILLSRISCFLVEQGSNTDAAAAYMNREDAVTIPFAPNDVQGFLNLILEQQKTQRVLAVTSSPNFTQLVLSLNASLSQNKLSVLCNGTFHLEDALTELRREQRMLHTADGVEYDPVRQLTEHMMATADGRVLLKRKASADETELFDYNGNSWGTLLSSRYHANDFCGTLHGMSPMLSLRKKAALLWTLIDSNGQKLPDAEHIALFRSGELEMVLLPHPHKMLTPAQMEFELFTNRSFHADGDLMEEMADWLQRESVPPCVLEDISASVGYQLFSNAKLAEPSKEQVCNTMERIVLMYKED